MKTRDKVLLGTVAGVGLAWGARQLLRARRRITLDDKVVVVTGASTGHGLIVARQAAEGGARLVLAARDEATLRAAEADLIAHGARDVLAVPTDVADPDQCNRLIDHAIRRHGRVDILVNNAGIIQVGPVETMTIEDFRAALATNFWGAVYCTLAVLPHMQARRFGRIANVVSVGGKMPVPHLLPYTSSKFALAGFTKGLRTEVAKDGILVTGIYPSTMRTGGHAHAWIKGRAEAEYAMFALSDTIPGVSASAEHVARALWRAVLDGDPEVNVGWQANLRAPLDALFPSWSAETLALLGAALPRASGPMPAIRGEHVPGRVAEWLTRQVPAPARPGTSG
ncbi:MAG TPA: SDR family NAD(P)-dependent oxidoreductase [Isosphaeraceae bacterium]|jgi:NAD(P)-dependent dehydrogenase (short-subunit alcohol dehydrogenase family)|nr:SDR family NAD(P)-dependent oxidoreductase [Isosphaeraceae bacterium]